jgi:pimeloyl-ACP methyl ester carboxylesterase
LLYGDKDRITPAQQSKSWAALIPNAKVHIVKDAGHLVLDEKEEAPNAVLDFLS